MIKKDEITGPSCLTRAADDEPLFVLRANDELAPGIIREWARRYYDSKMSTQGKLSADQKIKKNGALKLAMAMEAWTVAQLQAAKKKKKA